MLEAGAAYRCFCDPATLAERREKERQSGQTVAKDRCCANLSPEEIQAKIDAGESYAVRLLIPDETITVDDGVHGEVNVNGSEIEDFILLRSNGTPTYMLAVVVDDADMRVTHVIRGDDHLSNTPKQILLYRALGLTPPKFAHVPTILGSDKKKLSKRHGATSITEYRDIGYLPETMVNYLGLLGWSTSDDREVISRDELIEMFDIPGINKSSAVFDDKKLNWLNGQYIGKLDYDDVRDQLVNLASEAVAEKILNRAPEEADIHAAWNLFCNRIHLLPELFVWGDYIFQAPKDFDAKGVRKQFKADGAVEMLSEVADAFNKLTEFKADTVENSIRELAEAKKINGGKLIHPVRLAVSGTTGGPGLFELLVALGRDTVVARIQTAVKMIQSDSVPLKSK